MIIFRLIIGFINVILLGIQLVLYTKASRIQMKSNGNVDLDQYRLDLINKWSGLILKIMILNVVIAFFLWSLEF